MTDTPTPSAAEVLRDTDPELVAALLRLEGPWGAAGVAKVAAALADPQGYRYARAAANTDDVLRAGPAQLALSRCDNGEVDGLVCPTCGTAADLRYCEHYDTWRKVDGSRLNPEVEPEAFHPRELAGGRFVVHGEFDWGEGNATPGLVCIACDETRPLYLPAGWELDFS